MVEKYSDAYSRNDLITPEQARRQLETLGYTKLNQVPLGQSDYLTALFFIVYSKKPLNLAEVRDMVRACMLGRGGRNK